MNRNLWLERVLFALVILSAASLNAAEAPGDAGLTNVALPELGATARCNAHFNKDWPPSHTLEPGNNGGTIIDAMKDARVDIRLAIAVDIKAVEVVPLDYHGTRQPKAIDIFVDDKNVKHTDLEDKPGKPTRIGLEAHGQNVGIQITDLYPIRDPGNGKPGLDYGGWARLRVFSSTDVSDVLKPIDQYQAVALPANIAPTSGSIAEGKVEVFGEPRTTKGHPCTLWDGEDIAHYKEMLKSSKLLQSQFQALKKSMDVRMTHPLNIPQPKQGPDGQWLHLGDSEKDTSNGNGKTYGAIHNQLGQDIANLGTMYVLTGEEPYAEFCKKLLLAYADAHPHYGIGARPGFSHDPSKVFDQRLSDATWLIQVARGYDFIHNLPSITPEERKHIEEDLVKANARHIMGNSSSLRGPTNWSAIDTCAVLTAGFASDDNEIVNCALYGIKGTADKPTGGLYQKHFGSETIDEDGMWAEGAMGYQFMAMEALIMDAEILWHHGVDMYRYRDCALKRLFDSPFRISYPDMTTPATHDSGRDSIIGTEAYLYEYGYRHYRDPMYLLILNQAGMHLDAHFQQFPVSVLYDRDVTEKAPPVEWKSVNLFGVGFGILRTTTEAGTNSLLLEYGPNRSHGHPDKLTVDLYAFNDQLMPDPGTVWYEKPLYRQWYRTTLAHCTLTVDQMDQQMCGAHQLVFGPAESMGIERAWTADAYPGVIMDRAVFLTPQYTADIFGAFSRLPRKMDLAWHLRGDFATELPMEPMKFPEPVENGYCALSNVRHGSTDKAWSATATRKGKTAKFLAAGGTETEIIVGDGYYGVERPATILERRTKGSTLYGNAVDISGAKDGYVKSVTQEGTLEAGYGLLKVETTKGADLCFVSYRPGSFKASGIETDAQQAFVLMDGTTVRAMYLGGGKTLKFGSAALERSDAGLSYIEKADNGSFIVTNPSPAAATVTVTLPALAGLSTFAVDNKGQRTGAAESKELAAGSFSVQLKALGKVEFAPKDSVSAFDFRQNMLKKVQDDRAAALVAARDECAARTKVREAEAAAKPAPANTVVVVGAADFSAEEGAKISISDKKAAAVGKAIFGWDSTGHAIEWTFDVPADGYYNLSACYCSELDKIQREIKVNGEVQEPFAPFVFPTTGGWANGGDDWRLFTALNPTNEQPLLLKLKQGKNVIRLTNTNERGINVNYLAITSPDVKPTRELLAGHLNK